MLDVVKKAETLMLEKGENKEYLPIEGLAAFNKATVELLLGADNEATKQGRVCLCELHLEREERRVGKGKGRGVSGVFFYF